jgi:hypothetical protein
MGTVIGRVDIANSATPNRYEVMYHQNETFGPDLLARLDRSGRFAILLPVAGYTFEGLSPIRTGYGSSCATAASVEVSARTEAHPTYSCVLLRGVIIHGSFLGALAKTLG